MHSAEMAAGLDVVIVNWYAWDSLRRCVEHVRIAADRFATTGNGYGVRIVVVDNSLDPPPPDLVDWLADKAALVRPGRNLGFGAACNLGADTGSATSILFLNGDAWPHEDALAMTVARLSGRGTPGWNLEVPADQGAAPGIVSGRMVDAAGRVTSSCWRFPTVCRLTVEAMGLDRLRPFRDWGCRMRGADYDAAQPVDQVIGAFFAMPRDVFEAVGGFDERFFLYYEEVDLCRKVREIDRIVLFDPGIVFTHATEPMASETLAPRLAYNSHSRIVYARKRFGRVGAVYVAWLAIVVEPVVRMVASAFSHRGLPPRMAGRYVSRLLSGLRRGGWSRSVTID